MPQSVQTADADADADADVTIISYKPHVLNFAMCLVACPLLL